jgi:hypothetical protein
MHLLGIKGERTVKDKSFSLPKRKGRNLWLGYLPCAV